MTDQFDLHSHTTASDGTNAPAVNVRLAKEAGLRGLAITDHDTIAGVAEAVEEGRLLGVEVVPGVEISTVAGGQDIHVLGYYIDYTDETLLSRLGQLRETRNQRNDMMLAKLSELGLPVTMEEVLEVSKKKPRKDETVGRPHIAEVLVAKGYVSSIAEAFDRYLGKDGAAYVNPPRIRPEDAIDWIREAGGVSVLAHPGLYDDDELVVRLIGYGVAGIEAYHSDHTPDTEKRYAELAGQHGLIVTGGSDFHGSRNGVVFHAPLGARYVDDAAVKRLQAASRFFERS
ncbi:PHP domain-containing protein [Paenibacillus ginsengarvi]|uniref:PHP domain-containing protein n=1 Tax=Paenibacillus ginsengarvi TaxID=400777 RepID=A0A3B0CQW2_9BACL|nr:PHP domain-containing protein [Paenibacillus ginsengarvi]RKN86651.1 PHP domain-containing protein [Paenibacillus ginsengarvi]